MSFELQEISRLTARVEALEKYLPMLAIIEEDMDSHGAFAPPDQGSIPQSQTGSGASSPDTPATNS